MFHSLLVINSSSREIAVPTDEKEEKKEEEEEEEEEEKIKSKNKRKVVLVTKIFTLQTRVRSILTDSLLQRSRRRRRSHPQSMAHFTAFSTCPGLLFHVPNPSREISFPVARS